MGLMGMIIGGNGHNEWIGQPTVSTVGIKEGKMGMKVENGGDGGGLVHGASCMHGMDE